MQEFYAGSSPGGAQAVKCIAKVILGTYIPTVLLVYELDRQIRGVFCLPFVGACVANRKYLSRQLICN